jgi:hypothetical protein
MTGRDVACAGGAFKFLNQPRREARAAGAYSQQHAPNPRQNSHWYPGGIVHGCKRPDGNGPRGNRARGRAISGVWSSRATAGRMWVALSGRQCHLDDVDDPPDVKSWLPKGYGLIKPRVRIIYKCNSPRFVLQLILLSKHPTNYSSNHQLSSISMSKTIRIGESVVGKVGVGSR